MLTLIPILFPPCGNTEGVTIKEEQPTCTDNILPRGSLFSSPPLYALSKNGNVRTYYVRVYLQGGVPILETEKIMTIGGKSTFDRYAYTEGVNEGKSNYKTPEEKAVFDAESLVKRLHDKGFSYEHPKGEHNTDANGRMKPMLACGFSQQKIVFPCFVQPKYDGVRCIIFSDAEGVHILSRNGKPYKIPHLEKWAKDNLDKLPLDGELYCHKELTFQEIISAVKKVSDLTSKIRFVVYDRPIQGANYAERQKSLCEDFKGVSEDAVVYLSPTYTADTIEEVQDKHDQFVGQGYEGAIIRNTRGLYEFGFRSNDLIKLKRFDTEEFQIVDVVEASGRDEGTAIFVCECAGGRFNVKPQGTRELRTKYFTNKEEIIGKVATIQYQGLSDDGIPRFPSAITIRDYE